MADLDPSMRIVVLHGKEPFLISEASRRYTDLLREAYGDVARVDFDGETAEIADVLDELRSFALFEPHKLVVVDAADKFLAESDADKGQDEPKPKKRQLSCRRILEAYAEKPVGQASLLLRADSWRAGKLDKLVAKVGAVRKYAPLKDAEAVKWCVESCPDRHGVKIDRAAARLLVERVGTSLARLDTELAKLGAFSGSETIGLDEVRELVGRSREEQAWALQNAIMSGSAAEACTKLRELLEISRIDETLVSWAITDMLRRIHTASQLIRQGAGEQSFRQSLRLSWPPGDRMLEVARRAEPRRIAELFNEAVATVHRTRSSLGDRARNLEVLTVRVTDTIKCL